MKEKLIKMIQKAEMLQETNSALMRHAKQTKSPDCHIFAYQTVRYVSIKLRLKQSLKNYD